MSETIRTDHAAPARTREDLPSLTGIRGVAALWVLARHVDPLLGKEDFPGRSLMHNG